MPRSMELTLDEVLQAIAHRYRRRLLVSLMDENHNEETTMFEVFQAPDWNLETSIMLKHTHLSLLDDSDLVSWNRGDSPVGRGPNFDGIRRLLELLDEHQHELPGHWI